MRYDPIDQKLFVTNRQKLVKLLADNSIAIINSNDEMPRNGDQYHPFRQQSDLFYLTGIDQEKTVLVLCPQHPDPKYREVLFILKADVTLEIWHGHKLTQAEAKNISGVRTVCWLDEMDALLREMMLRFDYVYINQNEYLKFTPEVESRDTRFLKTKKELYPLHNYQRLAPLLTKLRLNKEPEELQLLKKACRITDDAFRRVLAITKPGMKEYEIEAELTSEFIRQGANGHAYAPIVAAGANACALHYIANDETLKDGDLLLMDFGAEYGNYAADCSRTFPVNGKFSERQRALYEATLRIFYFARDLMLPGTTIAEIHSKVCRRWEEEHIRLGLYSKEDLEKQEANNPLYFKYYMHGTSHFIGLDVHDVGDKQTVLEPGMVLSCEPGIYIAEEGIGIRIENDILITEGKPVDLMDGIPVEPDEIESIMSSKNQ
jgi:Xaa-Pro aminopeptidase